MEKPFKTMRFTSVDPASTAVKADRGYPNVTLSDPAISVMTDFRYAPAFACSPEQPVNTALDKMKTVGVRMLLVNDEDGLLHGIVTAADILGERALKAMESTRVKREELKVEDVMHTHELLRAFSLSDVLNASVGDLLMTLKSWGDQHVLVISSEGYEPKIRGLFSAAEIGRQLKIEFDPMTRAQSFSELGKTLLGSASQAA